MSKQKKLVYKRKGHKRDEDQDREPASYSVEERNDALDDFNDSDDNMSDVSTDAAIMPASSGGNNNRDEIPPPPPPPPGNQTYDDSDDEEVAAAFVRTGYQQPTHKHVVIGNLMQQQYGKHPPDDI